MVAEPAKKRFDPKLVDENYIAPENASAGEEYKGKLSLTKREGIAEGIRRQKAKQDAEVALQIKGVKSAHVDELQRSARIISKASYHQAWTHASLLWLVIAAAALFTGAWLQTSGFAMRVADERIPRAAVPVLQDNYTPPSYARDNPREPGDAR